MNYILICGLVIGGIAVLAILRFLWELLQQNGRMLIRTEALDKRLKTLESGAKPAPAPAQPDSQTASGTNQYPGTGQIDSEKSEPNQDDLADRFARRSLANSKIKRDGLKAGTVAPEFRLPRLDGGELSLSELRGKPVFVVFSSPSCGPCNALAPRLEKFHRKHPRLEIVMISKEDPDANREKVNEHGLTFPVVLQKQWEVSRDYAKFATPVAYLIDSAGVITADAAVGEDAVMELAKRARQTLDRQPGTPKTSWTKRLTGWMVRTTFACLHKFSMLLGSAMSKLQLFDLTHFKLLPRADDIFIVTYPRSGTTWTQMILYQLTTDGSMEIPHIAEHCPWFERSVRSAQDFEKRKSPRIFKSHLSYENIPKGPGRYIYVARDGKDVAVSYYNLYRNYNGYKGTFAEFFEEFMNGKVTYGSWFKHVASWWQHRDNLNVLFLTYEELQRDLESCIRRISAFCRLHVPAAQMPRIIERCSFAFMKEHEQKFDPALEVLWEQGTQLKSFLRSGHSGEGARELTPEQQVRFDEAARTLLQTFWSIDEPQSGEHPPPTRPIYAQGTQQPT